MSLIVNVKFDALVFVILDITPSKDQEAIHNAFDDIMISGAYVRDKDLGLPEFAFGGYRRSIQIPINNCDIGAEPKYFRLYIDPFSPDKAYVKVELKKHPYSANDYKLVNATLQALFYHCATNYLVAEKLRIKLLDIAIDINTDISNLWFNNKRTQVSMQVFGKSGKYETTYLGDKRAKFRIRIYDKAAQQKSKDRKNKSHHALLRIEFSIRPNCTIDQLMVEIDMISKLDKFYIYKSKAIRNAEIFSDEICSLIDYVGIKSILQSMDQSKRRAALKQMKPFRSHLISKQHLKNQLKTLEEELRCLYEEEE